RLKLVKAADVEVGNTAFHGDVGQAFAVGRNGHSLCNISGQFLLRGKSDTEAYNSVLAGRGPTRNLDKQNDECKCDGSGQTDRESPPAWCGFHTGRRGVWCRAVR